MKGLCGGGVRWDRRLGFIEGGGRLFFQLPMPTFFLTIRSTRPMELPAISNLECITSVVSFLTFSISFLATYSFFFLFSLCFYFRFLSAGCSLLVRLIVVDLRFGGGC